MPNDQKLTTMVKRSMDQKLRLRNFDARHGKIETGAVVKSCKRTQLSGGGFRKYCESGIKINEAQYLYSLSKDKNCEVWFSSVCFRDSLRGSFREWPRVCIQVRLHAERECGDRALGNQMSVDNHGCERMRVQEAHASVARNMSNTSGEHTCVTCALTQVALYTRLAGSS